MTRMKVFLFNAVVLAGFLAGNAVAGFVGSVVAGIGAFLGALFVAEKLESKRASTGFWLRYRGTMVIFLANVVAVVLCSLLVGDFWGILIGIVVGACIGEAIANQLGWGGHSLESQIEFCTAYLSVLASAANAGGTVSEKRSRLVISAAKDLFTGLGYGDDADMAPLAQNLLSNPPNALDAGSFASVLTPKLAPFLQADVCKVLFADGALGPPQMAWLEQFQTTANLTDWSVLKLFSRHLGRDEVRRTKALNELGLAPYATDQDIRKAYRELAMQYHPDRQDPVAPHLRDLAAQKMAAVNDAYNFLTKQETPGPLHFQELQGRSFSPPERKPFDCKCWLCGQSLHVPRHADLSSVRCAKCHSLAGLDFDPAPITSANQAGNPTEGAQPHRQWTWLLVVVAVVVGIYLLNRDSHPLGRRLAFGECELFCATGIKESEAQQVGAILVREKYFAERPASVQVRLEDGRYELRCVVQAGTENDDKFDRVCRRIADAVSKECFRAAPVDVHLCDERFRTKRMFVYEPIKPELPIRVTYRWSIGGGSLVAQFRNKSMKIVTVRATVKNLASGKSQTMTLSIGPNQMTEHGWAEGWRYQPGDRIDITHVDYEPLALVVPPAP